MYKYRATSLFNKLYCLPSPKKWTFGLSSLRNRKTNQMMLNPTLMNGYKVLVLEDDYSLRHSLMAALRAFHEIEGAETIMAAWKLISSRHFDVVILDKNLPDGSGFDLIAPIKSLSPKTGIIVITGEHELRSLHDAIKFGADDYLIKDNEILSHLLIRIPLTIQKLENAKSINCVEIKLPTTANELNRAAYEDAIKIAEIEFLKSALKLCNGSAAEVAKSLKMGRSTIFQKLSFSKNNIDNGILDPSPSPVARNDLQENSGEIQ